MRNTEFDYEPDPLGRVGYGAWTPRARRDPFGRLPEDEDEPLAELRRRWLASEHLENDDSIFALGGAVGEGADNDRLDVAKVQIALHNEGRFDLDRSGGPTGYFSPPLGEAIRRRQAEHGLAADGELLPDGETIRSLKERAAVRERDLLGAPLPARPGERPTTATRSPTPGVQVAGNAAIFVRGGLVLARWLMREGSRRYAERAARRAAEALADAEAQAALRAARSAGAAPPIPDPAKRAPAADATERNKAEIVSEDAVRAWLNEGLAGLALPMAGSRGSDDPTQKGLDILAQECRDVLDTMWPEVGQVLEHEFGSTKDGKRVKRQSEMVIKDESQGKSLKNSNRPDQSWWFKTKDKEEPESYLHINSGKTLKDGVTPISRERRQIVGLIEKVGATLVHFVRKPEKGFDEDEYRAYAREECIGIMASHLGAPTGSGGSKK